MSDAKFIVYFCDFVRIPMDRNSGNYYSANVVEKIASHRTRTNGFLGTQIIRESFNGQNKRKTKRAFNFENNIFSLGHNILYSYVI